MEQQINSKQDNELPREKHSFGLSIRDAGWFAAIYAIGFIVFRFDINRHGPSFRHPMTTGKSALIALLLATVMSAYWKIRPRGR